MHPESQALTGYISFKFCFLARIALIKDKAIILVNSQSSLTNRAECGIMFTLHKLHIFYSVRENTLVKRCFLSFLIPYRREFV